MKDFANKYLEKYNGYDKIIKILLCLLWDVPSTLYRVSKSALKDNTLGVVLAIIIGIFGGWLLFIIDIFTLALKDKILWLDDFDIDESEMANAFKSDKKDEQTAPAEAAPAEETPSEETPAEETPAEETPAEEEPAKDGEVEG